MLWLARQFELGRAGAAANLRPMEGLRGVAVLLVFLVHYGALVAPLLAAQGPAARLAGWLADLGNSGVDLFFMLSGYLIYGALMARPQRFLVFMARRVERIYPTFIAVFALYLLLSLAVPSESKIPAPASAGLLYLAQNFLLLPGLLPIVPMIKVAWSLSYEMFFYVLLGLLVKLAPLRAWPARVRVGMCVASGLALLIVCGAYGGPVRMLMFIGGMLLFEALRSPRMAAPRDGVVLTVLVLACLASAAHPGLAVRAACLCVAFGMLCFACFRHPAARLGSALSWTPLRWLGNMSYSFYLLHGLALKALVLLMPADASGGVGRYLLLLAPAFAFSWLASALLFLAVERPCSLARASGTRSISGSLSAGVGRARHR